ncbi:hypothetical protein FDG2_3322 [Candidatus Protofrankia californiensis]|uniref:DyP dimeric alpha+beta barrel domain-containing protein n=1 Tax=Candidatus Protofrankia californiensis TaxID=1839754 RepID=A0A1C3NZH0_9ACTN|nr:hypothetical protein FDG2_3322 [Candidatus Protofrankia californiensis]
MQVNLQDVQAMVLHLFKHPTARHLIFRFGNRDGARAFIRKLAPHITMADVQLDTTPDPLLNIGVTFNGLNALEVDPKLLKEFDAVYQAGPDALALGDVIGSRSDPATWWEGRFKTEDVHCIVHIYARSDDAAEVASQMVRDLTHRSGLRELIPRRDSKVLESHSLGSAKLHFGYTDGISHPNILWNDAANTSTGVDFRTFFLGYSTPEYSSVPDHGPAADLVRNSTYGMFRWIYQDVATFNQFLSTKGPQLFPDLASAEAEELLAAKLMGRWRDGTPLVLSPHHPDPHLTASNNFGYKTQDPNGYQCPFSAHIRVVNPRDQQLDELVQVDGVPHVLRRGMPYGPPLEDKEDDGVDRGLVGIFLCANLRRQIYKLAGWIKKNDFSPVFDATGHRRTQDALIGNRQVEGSIRDFTLPSESNGLTIKELPDFIYTKGTVFLLYPGKSTLAALSE